MLFEKSGNLIMCFISQLCSMLNNFYNDISWSNIFFSIFVSRIPVVFGDFRRFPAISGDFRRFPAIFYAFWLFFNSYCSKEVVVAYHTNKTKLLQKSGFPGKNPDFFNSYRSKEVVVAAYHTNNPAIKRSSCP